MIFEEIIPNEQLRRVRHQRGWTQAELAEQVGATFETVSRWERGITVPSAYYREKLCDVFGMTAEELGLMSSFSISPTFPLVFLASAYADAEKEIVRQLKAEFHVRGISMWSSRQQRKQGAYSPKKALQEAICAAQMVLVIVSPEARSSRHIRETLEMTRMYRRPVCTVWIEGEHWQQCLPSGCNELYATIDARKKYDHILLDEIIAQLEHAGFPSKATLALKDELSNSQTSHTEPRNPYKGLQAFRVEDRHDFFGRDKLIDELIHVLKTSLLAEQQSAQSSRLLAVIGPSGSGKSSVVMAGLLPRLQAGGLTGSEKWIYLNHITPGVHPLETLALVLAQHLPDRSLTRVREDLENDSTRGLHLLASSLRTRLETPVVLFVDQFEELFTQTTSQEERQRFIEVLVTAMTELHGPLIALLTVRADFYDRLAEYPELAQLIQAHHQLVLPMGIDALREVIEKPAALPDVQLTFEGDLVGDLLFEVYGQVGSLPLLEFTLDQLFQRRIGQLLTLQAYREIGGVKGALARYAESMYASLPSGEHHRLARTLFLRLIDPGATEQDTTRRRAALSELLLPDPKETVILGEVATAFTTARLLTTNMVAGSSTIEVSHEALIREWTRLSGWLREAREDIRLQRIITEDTTEWEQRNKPGDRLYRGSQLKDARAWARRNMPSSYEVAFLRASTVQRIRVRANVLALLLLLIITTGTALRLFLLTFNTPNTAYVTNLIDQGPGSLRWAIDQAIPGSTITFAPALKGTIALTTNDLDINKILTIRGPGADILTISSDLDHNIRVLSGTSVSISGLAFEKSKLLQNSFIENSGQLTLSNCMISGNVAYGKGGGITNSGMLTITNSTISNNSGNESGGITNSGTLTLTNSTISGNSGYSKGGIYNSGTLTLINSKISDNTTQGEGGGIYNSGNFDIMNSTISDNRAYGKGGGIFNSNDNTTSTSETRPSLTNSTVSGNIAAGNGGGIDNNALLNVINSTLSDNKADGEGGGISSTGFLGLTNSTVSDNTAFTFGGGIAIFEVKANSRFIVFPSTYMIALCTIYGNTATKGRGGGLAISNESRTDPKSFSNSPGEGIVGSIVVGNRANADSNISGQIWSRGYNLFQYVSLSTNFASSNKHPTDINVYTSTNLAIDTVLRKNGGPTQTHALLPGSPAIDRIPLDIYLHIVTETQRNTFFPDYSIATNNLLADQRGVKRPLGNGCDIGAYEFSP